jgi:diphthine methyl ester acylhydrolase
VDPKETLTVIVTSIMSQSVNEQEDEYLQFIETPLHACSLESLQSPIETPCGRLIWPLMLGCYELDPVTNHRKGHLDLYAVQVPTDDTDVSLDPPLSVVSCDDVSGILDGKWCPQSSQMLYATAHATGEIQLHRVEVVAQDDGSGSSFPLRVSNMGQSNVQDALCLSVSWDFDRNDASSTSNRRLISSYSDGHVAIHTVHHTQDESSSAQLETCHSWDAHRMFTSPAEVWTACFTTHDQVVMSGGDEGQCKLWDLRLGTRRPIHSLSFEAGATVLSPHPRKEHWVACGSYDETVKILDLRMLSTDQGPRMLCHSEPLGGGIWRIKWHPDDDHRLLVAAMHGGCRVVDLVTKDGDFDEDQVLDVRVCQAFTRHKSMAYGADWLVCANPQWPIATATSCSFYDKALYTWKTGNNSST